MIKILVSGAKGKMGAEVIKAVSDAEDMEFAGGIDINDDLAQAITSSEAKVVVDFTHPKCVLENTLSIIKSGAYAVIGTTGLSETNLKLIAEESQKYNIATLVAPNFAIGAILMMKYAAEISKYMPSAEIIELHHDKKADAPSGTAIKTAEMIHAANHSANTAVVNRDEKIILPGARGGVKHNIPIHSVRLPGYVAHQEVIFGGMGQTLTIRHDTTSREAFMPGVLLGIRKIVNMTGLVYGLENLI